MLVIDSQLMLSAWVAQVEKCRQRLNLKLEFIVLMSSFHYIVSAGDSWWKVLGDWWI